MSGKTMAELLADNPVLQGPTLSDAEWRVRDAAIRAELERQSAGDTVAADNEKRRQRTQLDEWGMSNVPVEQHGRMVHRRKLVSWGVPVDIVEAVEMDALEMWPALLQARQFEMQIRRRSVLVMEGTHEEGKSSAAAWWVAQPGPVLPYLDGGAQTIHPPRFLTASDFERMSKFSNTDIDRVHWARRLVLDDLGFQGRYPDMVRRLVSLIAHRVAMRLPMVITSNLSKAEWAEIFQGHDGGSVFSRLDRSAIWWTAAKGTNDGD